MRPSAGTSNLGRSAIISSRPHPEERKARLEGWPHTHNPCPWFETRRQKRGYARLRTPGGAPHHEVLAVSRLTLVRIEALLQPAPAVDIVVLQCFELSRIFRDALPEARLEHEGERVRKL